LYAFCFFALLAVNVTYVHTNSRTPLTSSQVEERKVCPEAPPPVRGRR